MARPIAENHPLHRLFRGLTEYTFQAELGIGDPELVGYVSGLLVRFVPSDEVCRIRDSQGKRLTEVTALLQEAEKAGSDERKRDCWRHAGDVSLFWTGLFPEAVGAARLHQSADCLIDLQQQGKRSYYLASTIAEDRESGLFRKLSQEFELCAYGLSRVRKEWEALPAVEAGGGKLSPLIP